MDFTKDNKDNIEVEENEIPYTSQRLIIKGLHLFFIDIAREIIEHNCIQTIPLMREYHLSETELNKIIQDIKDAKIIDANYNATMSVGEFERFIDIYEPSMFDCKYSVFDKEIFMCIGEIIYDKGVQDTYTALSADEVVDYLTIMEKLKIISYDDNRNEYDILATKADFERICKCIPNSFGSTKYKDDDVCYTNVNYDNLSGTEFERYCAHIISQNGFYDIKITPPSGDHGIDIICNKNDIGYAIQCKCYSDNVGNAAVQQAHTGKSLYHKDVAVVMTNRYFTPQAIEEAKALGVRLWDRDRLNEMINTK